MCDVGGTFHTLANLRIFEQVRRNRRSILRLPSRSPGELASLFTHGYILAICLYTANAKGKGRER
jgi:hypothetical protein